MATVAKENKPAKAERKKPVRKSPARKDYSTKLEWLAAMTEYEQAQAEVSSAAKVTRLDKRIAAAKELVSKTNAKIAELEAERDKLVPAEPEGEDEGTEPTPEQLPA